MLPLVSIIQRALDRAPVLALFALACMASGTGTAAGSPNVLERFAAHPATARTYQLGIGGCREASCPIEVRLAAGNKVIDTAVLEWPASDARAKHAPVDWTHGVGDPSASPSGLRAWTMGEEEQAVSVAARSVRIAPDRSALLVTQLAGFDHLKRRHDLFLVDGDRLQRIWSYAEPPGPHWSSTTVRPSRGKAEEVVLATGFLSPTDEAPDRLEIQKLDWQAATKQVDQNPAEAFLVTAGSFASIEQARQMRASNHGCLAHYWVLGAASSAAEQGPVIVATLSSTRQAAHHEMRRAKACAPSIRTDMKVVEGSRVP
jgi:hypothetical protein